MYSYSIKYGKNVNLFQLSKCIPIPEPESLMYSDSGRNGYHPITRSLEKMGISKCFSHCYVNVLRRLTNQNCPLCKFQTFVSAYSCIVSGVLCFSKSCSIFAHSLGSVSSRYVLLRANASMYGVILSVLSTSIDFIKITITL